jgi:hypothetical protein
LHHVYATMIVIRSAATSWAGHARLSRPRSTSSRFRWELDPKLCLVLQRSGEWLGAFDLWGWLYF